MQIVIDIPEDRYKLLQKVCKLNGYDELDEFQQAVINGTPLPKGHGRLIDKDKMIADLLTVDPQYKETIDWCCQVTEAQPTIIGR